MKARFINEIKRDIEGSGLGAIGIGRVALLKVYNYIKQNMSSLMNYAEELDDIDSLPDIVKDKVCEFLHETPDGIVGISHFSLMSERMAGYSADFTEWVDTIRNYETLWGSREKFTIGNKSYTINELNREYDLIEVHTFLKTNDNPLENTVVNDETYFFFRL